MIYFVPPNIIQSTVNYVDQDKGVEIQINARMPFYKFLNKGETAGRKILDAFLDIVFGKRGYIKRRVCRGHFGSSQVGR
jgi:hypothetical protein